MIFLFDIDDTLYDLEDPFKMAIEEFDFKNCVGEDNLHELFLKFRKYNNEIYHRALEGEISMDFLCKYRIKRALSDFCVEIDDDTAYRFQMMYLDKKKNIRLNKYVKMLLESLKKANINIGIISNGPHKEQYEKLSYLGMWDYVDRKHVFISEDIGYFKPDNRIFEACKSSFENDGKESFYYIGDSYYIDVLGALSSDIVPIWFNHRKVVVDDKVDVIEIKSWKDICTLIPIQEKYQYSKKQHK